MPFIREIYAQPAGGWADRPWDRDASLDAFGRVAVGVEEQLARAVRENRIEAARQQFRVSTVTTTENVVGVDTIDIKRMGPEGCRADVPTIFRELDRAAQIETVRRTFAFALRAHAELRDWDRAALERALQTGLGDEHPFVWEGRRRTSRSRRHSAVLRGRFAATGTPGYRSSSARRPPVMNGRRPSSGAVPPRRA